MRRLLCGRSRGAWASAPAVKKPTDQPGQEGADGGGKVHAGEEEWSRDFDLGANEGGVFEKHSGGRNPELG